MRLVIDRGADAAMIYLVPSVPFGGAARTEVCDVGVPNSAINLDFDDDNHLIAIEVLGASRLLPKGLLHEAPE